MTRTGSGFPAIGGALAFVALAAIPTSTQVAGRASAE
jgi:hypothetical protein